MKTGPAKTDMTKYCDFHRNHGHRIDDCIQLKKEIEFLIRRGHLRHYVALEDRNQAPPPPPRQSALAQHQQSLGEINVISGGFVGGGESSSARKAHLRSFRSRETLEVQAVSELPRLDTAITFLDADLEGCQHPHDDPLVIRVVVANKIVHKVLIDNRSSTDIIFASTFDKMGIGREKLESVNAHLRGFSGERVLPLGLIQLVLTLGDPPLPDDKDDKIPHRGGPIGVQHVTGQAFPQCHKGHPLRLSYGRQIPYRKWGRKGPGRQADSPRVLLSVNEAESS